MAVVRELTANLYNDSSSPNTQTINCTGVDTLLVLVEDPVNTAGNTTGATFNSVALTEIGRRARGGTNRELILYGIHNPYQGSATLSVSRSSDAVARFLVGAVGLSGTDTSFTLSGAGISTAGTTGTSATLDFTNDAGAGVYFISTTASGGQTASTGTTVINTNDIVGMWVSNPAPADASQSCSITFTNSAYALLGVAVPAAGGTTPTFTPRVSFII